MDNWQVHVLKYADRDARRRRGDQVILVDTGYDDTEAVARGRPIRLNPVAALAPFGLQPESINDVIVTHLHYDHTGGLHLFPNAQLHLQAAEMAFATGPCMCHDVLRMPFTAGHVCEAVKRLYSGKQRFYQGDGQVAEGVTVYCIGGHSQCLQAVRLRNAVGWLVLASDTAHFYENLWAHKPFPIVVDLQDMLDGFTRPEALASAPSLIIPGHDPLVRAHFSCDLADHICRLDQGPSRPVPLFS